ncbi:MAG: 3-methyl-2-oxobutanoate hydroxymethyltransferase, partial [Candidatus Micrarchaeota archaeon]
IKAGIPVMGHVGMTPQSVNRFGGFRVQGKGSQGEQILEDAKQVESAGVFALVLELIPAALAMSITQSVACPTIGIGAGPHCDGQIQVFHDILGFDDTRLKHTKRYAEVGAACLQGLKQYTEEVRGGQFPKEEHSF